MSKYFVLYVVLVLACSSCSKQYQVLFQQRNALQDTAAKATAIVPEYRIKPRDILELKNLQNDNKLVNLVPYNQNASPRQAQSSDGDTFTVDDDGSIELPGITGKVQVGGLTRQQAKKRIEDLYRRELLKNPIIELKIVNLNVTLLGEVKSPGNYPLSKDKTTLVDLIGQAGGFTDKANEKNVEIIRGKQLNPSVTVIDLSKISSINDPGAVLQSGDIVYVSQNKRTSRQANLQSFSSIIQPTLIILNTALIIIALIRR